MLAAIRSASVLGIDAVDVTVEVDVALGLPQWIIVGLPASAVKESRERVSAALVNAGFSVPPRRITVNLAPADIRKEGTAFDLPIALGVLAGCGVIDAASIAHCTAVGELGLDGEIRPVRGALSIARNLARHANARAAQGASDNPSHAAEGSAQAEITHGSTRGTTLILPRRNVAEASLVHDVALCAPSTLRELVDWISAGQLPRATADASRGNADAEPLDIADVAGQEAAKRALTIAAAGAHGLLLIGPPGAGKTMLARRLPTILPALTDAESLEVTAIHSVAGMLDPASGAVTRRPFRAPHHSVSTAGLVGGGSSPRPGEVSLAHLGVLFLDELLEFPRYVLEALRQPMEDGTVTISRASSSLRFPARFALAAAMNPCPCGHAGDPTHACSCAAAEVARYQGRLSGPLADRIDLHVHVPPVSLTRLAARDHTTTSADLRNAVERARRAQRVRYANDDGCNARAPGRWLEMHARLEPAARSLLATAGERLGLSARAFHRVLRVARTIADLDDNASVGTAQVSEALGYRPRRADAQLAAQPRLA